MTEQDKQFFLAWTKALEEHGTNARINDVWLFSSALDRQLEKEKDDGE